MVANKKGKQKSGTRKHGRNEVTCQRYKREKRREKNKLRRLLKYIKKHPNDKCAFRAIDRLREFIK